MPRTTDETATIARTDVQTVAVSLAPRTVRLGDIARMCGKSYSWAKRMRANGQLPTPHIERRDSLGRFDEVEWLLADVEEWILLGRPSGDLFSRERRKARR